MNGIINPLVDIKKFKGTIIAREINDLSKNSLNIICTEGKVTAPWQLKVHPLEGPNILIVIITTMIFHIIITDNEHITEIIEVRVNQLGIVTKVNRLGIETETSQLRINQPTFMDQEKKIYRILEVLKGLWTFIWDVLS